MTLRATVDLVVTKLFEDLEGSCGQIGAGLLTDSRRVGVVQVVALRNRGATAMDFPVTDLLDETACYDRLVELLHPDSLACPRCGQRDHLGVHRRHRDPVLDYQCRACGRVFNAFTGTVLQGTQRRPAQILAILRGIAQGVPTAQLARELNCDRMSLLDLRHRLQEHARRGLDQNPLDDDVVEADEMYQNAGEKRHPASRPGRSASAASQPPPGPGHLRHRPAADRRRGRSGIEATPHGGPRPCRRGDLGRGDHGHEPGGDDDQHGRLERIQRPGPHALGPRPREPLRAKCTWARDDDGDGIREVHCNTLEGLWTGLRNFLRPSAASASGIWTSMWRSTSGATTSSELRMSF